MRFATCALLLLPFAAAAQVDDYVGLPATVFRSVLQYADAADGVPVAAFEMQTHPVTNAEFLAFVEAHPRWRRDSVPALFAESRYLSHWQGPLELGASAQAGQPVVWVSWFAADAFCKSRGARLPAWNEWEYAAAADASRRDARDDPAWREAILGWYARPSTEPLPAVAQREPNVWGIHDLHGLVWEWADDTSAMLVSSDSREQGDADRLKFCGAGALSMRDRENYAVLMRVALLSSLGAADATANLGFRCARNTP